MKFPENPVNIEYSEALRNYTLIDGLTPIKIKRKYIWLLNALVDNAIIGEDDYGLVWYSGTWKGGEWEDGTWYSGIWEDGDWKNGKFYSYYFDKKQLLQRRKVILQKDNHVYSEFRKGIWRRGDFFGGYFGPIEYNDNWEYISSIESLYYNIRWESGTFYNGIFRNASWRDGVFKNGIFYNSDWRNGTFLNGTFQGYRWRGGFFNGGDFVSGEWLDGKFNQTDKNIKSRFGSMPLTGTTLAGISTKWYNGEFINGEFHSGLNIISGKTNISDNHNRTWWYDGIWSNGVWFGGTHVAGEFNNGYWLSGYWSGGTFNNGYWENGFWESGVVNDGFFEQGLFLDVTFKGGQLGYEPPYYLIERNLSFFSGNTIPPNYLHSLPSVITDTTSEVTSTSIIVTGEVVSDGGEVVISRGFCWSLKPYPNIKENDFTDEGYGVGGFGSYIYNLIPGTYYYIRSYAKNSVGISYGNRILVTTL